MTISFVPASGHHLLGNIKVICLTIWFCGILTWALFPHQGKVAEKIHEVTLHTEDIEDSICAVRSMAEFGLPIADDMIKDINKSLKIMSKTQPKRGFVFYLSWQPPLHYMFSNFFVCLIQCYTQIASFIPSFIEQWPFGFPFFHEVWSMTAEHVIYN